MNPPGFVHFWIGDHTGGPACGMQQAGVFTYDVEKVGCSSCRQQLCIAGVVPADFWKDRAATVWVTPRVRKQNHVL